DTADTNADLQTALTTLSASYSPTGAHPTGKYVLNVAHHVHAEEVFSPVGGLTDITDGGGGAGEVALTTPAPNSILRAEHPAIMRGDYSATAHTLTMTIICGAVYTPQPEDPCTYGSTLYTQTFTAPGGGTPPPNTKQWVTNPGVEANLTGWTGTYGGSPDVAISRTTAEAHTGSASILVQANAGAANLSSGYSDNQTTVTNATQGTTYTASVWVKGNQAGDTINLRLREWTGTNTLVTDQKVTQKFTDTNWHQLTVQLTAQDSGSRLAFAVYGSSFNAGESFAGDDMSLTSPI
ncbi:MAG TPA: carbohydrate binding domain-containing protein, partial [Micromonosporaceae bacterium]